MSKLRTSEIINLIAAIDDSIFLNWIRQSNQAEPNQHPGWKDLPPVENRQGALQMIDMVLALLEDPEYKKLAAEEHGERGK
jgi:hypothetical protein